MALACIVASGFFLRIHQLGADDLWTDEAFTGFLALTHEWVSYLRTDNTPPLYYLLMRLWCNVVPCAEFGLRLPSALAGTAFVGLVALFSGRLFGREAALLVALIAALSPIHIYYSQEARVYSILLTMLLLFLFLQWRVVSGRSTPSLFVALFLAGACVLYLHYLALIVVAVCALVYAIEKLSGYRDVPPGYFLAVGGAVLAFSPWLVSGLFGEQSTRSELSWIATYLSDKPMWELPIRSLTTFLVGPVQRIQESDLFLKRYSDLHTPAVVYLLNSAAVVLFLALCVIAAIGGRALSGAKKRAILEMSAYMVLPLLAMLAVSVLGVPLYVVGRYDLIAFPAFLLVAAGVIHLAARTNVPTPRSVNRFALGAMVILVVGLQSYGVVAHKTTEPSSTAFEANTAAVAHRIGNGDGLLIATPAAVQIWYYLHSMGFDRVGDWCTGHGKRFACRLFPRALERAPASLERMPGLYGGSTPSLDLDYFLKDIPAGASVILMPDEVRVVDGEITIDRVGGGLASTMLAEGYSLVGVDSENSHLVFKKEALTDAH